MWGMAGWTGSDDEESLAVARSRGRARLQLLRHRLGLRRRTQRAAARRAAEAASGQAAVRRDQDPAEEPQVAGAARRTPLDDVFPADYIREYTETSLRNLGVSTIDLQQFHVWDDEWADDDRWQRAIARSEATRGWSAPIGISVNRWEPANVLRALDTGLDRRGAGRLQRLRPGAGGRAVRRLPASATSR